MAENLTSWQMIAGVYKRVIHDRPGTWDRQVVEVSISEKIAEIVRNDELCYAAVSEKPVQNEKEMKIDFTLITGEGKDYLILFPDSETAQKMGMQCISCSTGYILKTLLNAQELAGIQLIVELDEKNKSYSIGEITKEMAQSALSMTE
ncbi:MAG: hypothetical protein K2N49_02915 [Ruminococcus sp.]|nr:hypothetical protein [Ruminococcus sp.]MDE7225798.1 hypothetical protein [Ruminococcus sp.]